MVDMGNDFELDAFCLGDKWPFQMRLDLLKYIPKVYLHPASWKVDVKSVKSQWWCFFYECETVSGAILEILPKLIDPRLRNPRTSKPYNGFTFFILDERDTSHIYYSTRLIRKGVPVGKDLSPKGAYGFERILDGWIYTNDPVLSLHKY